MTVLIFIGRIFSLPLIILKYVFKRVDGPTRLRLILEELGGVYLKLGQILAMRFDLLPMKYALGLLDLLDNTGPTDNAIMFKDKMKDYLEYVRREYHSVLVPIGTGVEMTIKSKR